MKKRILSILLLCCMVLTLLPTTAFALTSINVSTEEELLAALADKTIDRIGVTSDITVSRTLEIDRSVEIVVASALQLDQAQSGSDRLFHKPKTATWPCGQSILLPEISPMQCSMRANSGATFMARW